MSDRSRNEALGGLGIAAALDKDVEHVAVGTSCAPAEPHRFAADTLASLGNHITDISPAQRKPMISSDRVGDDFTMVR